jgi:hypothetical protein
MSEQMISANTALLKVKEQLQENLSSVQIARTLDSLIFKSLGSMIQHTDHIEYVLVELLYHIFHNMRRKFSNKPHDELRDALFSLIVNKKKTGKVAEIRRLGLERSIYFKILRSFEIDAQTYITDMEQALVSGTKTEAMRAIEVKYRAADSPGFYHACTNTLFWARRAFTFRNMIVEKFIRLAYVEAQKARAKTGLTISLDDLVRNMVLSIFKAIDKYDPEQGPLTSYIKWWFLDAKNGDAGHEEGVAYSIPLSVRRKLLSEGVVNIYAPIDETVEKNKDDTMSILDRLAEEQDMKALHNIVARADTEKIFSLSFGVIYTLTERDKQALRSTLTAD